MRTVADAGSSAVAAAADDDDDESDEELGGPDGRPDDGADVTEEDEDDDAESERSALANFGCDSCRHMRRATARCNPKTLPFFAALTLDAALRNALSDRPQTTRWCAVHAASRHLEPQ